MAHTSAMFGRILIVKTPAGYVMKGKTYPTLTAATDAANEK